MTKSKRLNELRVGLFVVVCLAGLVYMTYSTGKLSFRHKGYVINVIFPEAAGLEIKAPVMLNGLEVGKVDEIQPAYDGNKTEILLKIWLEEKAKIRKDSKFFIQMMGLMGEKYIQIISSDDAQFIGPGSILRGEPYVDLSVLISNVNSFVEENKKPFKSTMMNFEVTSENFVEFSDDLRRNPWKLLFKTKEKLRAEPKVQTEK
ncbi:MAG TPA: MlaD family protein [Candidatus Omnitrophota bacterium]|nr:MlaD family protein [Candidatus Omnitrophota bacterium]HQL41410.1 MlaD family protein [Candidatus Omnitrophota bacterium]